MREIAIRVPADAVETVLDELLPLAPHGVFDVERGDEVELRVRGFAGELPERDAVVAAAGSWLRWSAEREVPDDWREQRKLDSEPVLVTDGLSIRTQWSSPLPGDGVDIVLDDRRAAFGRGVHPTTRGCLQALAALPANGSFADLGCGSGVLAIAAAKLGFTPVAAFDLDPGAVAAAVANASANAVNISVREADLASDPPPQAEVVAANVTADLHVRLAEGFAAACPLVLIAAGMRAEEAGEVAEAYGRACGLEVRSVRGTSEWPVLELGPVG